MSATKVAISMDETLWQRLDRFRDQFKSLSSPDHPLRVALDKLQTLGLVRIIVGHA